MLFVIFLLKMYTSSSPKLLINYASLYSHSKETYSVNSDHIFTQKCQCTG